MKITKLAYLIVIFIFYLFFNLSYVSANHCFVGTPSCDLDGFQQCPSVQLQCDYGCELLSTSPGSSCPNGGDDCNNWGCLLEPVYGCTDSLASNYNPSATADDGSCEYNNYPSDPFVTGNDWAIIYKNTTFNFNSTDPLNYRLRYGVDYSSPLDGVVDEWIPSTGFVNSGVDVSFIHNWSVTGYQKFNVSAQNENGFSSNQVKKELTVYDPDATLIATPENLYWGDAIDLSFDGVISPTSLDWVALYAVEADQEDYIDWLYVSNCTKTGGAPRSSGNCIFYAPSQNGEYIFRLFENDGWNLLSTSNVINVTENDVIGGGGGSGGSTYNITVSVLQGPGGNVRSLDNIIDTSVCGSPCVKSYSSGSTVTLQAIPSSSYWKFNGWTGGGCFNTSTCVINVGVDTEISASFTPRLFIYIEQ